MNYTGRPSISGCRPVLSLYPTHCFCQYLLRIFITFTNSPLFSRAFYTNSRSPLSHASLDSSPRGGAGDDRRQWRKQGGAVGAAASRMRAAAKQTLGAATRPWRGACDETERARLWQGASFPVSFGRIICYNGFAALPAHFMGREVKPNGVYFYPYPVRRSKCSILLHLQVA